MFDKLLEEFDCEKEEFEFDKLSLSTA